MKENERYVVKKISKDCLFPETLCELKDTKSKLYVVLENIADAYKIKDLLNQQDKRIEELGQENGYIIFSDGYDKNGNVVRKQEFVKYKDKFNELVKENRQLKSRLNALKKYQQ